MPSARSRSRPNISETIPFAAVGMPSCRLTAPRAGRPASRCWGRSRSRARPAWKTAAAARKTCSRPYWSLILPTTGMATICPRAKIVIVHRLQASGACKSRVSVPEGRRHDCLVDGRHEQRQGGHPGEDYLPVGLSGTELAVSSPAAGLDPIAGSDSISAASGISRSGWSSGESGSVPAAGARQIVRPSSALRSRRAVSPPNVDGRLTARPRLAPPLSCIPVPDAHRGHKVGVHLIVTSPDGGDPEPPG